MNDKALYPGRVGQQGCIGKEAWTVNWSCGNCGPLKSHIIDEIFG